MGPLKHVGLALATSLSSWLNVILLATTLARRGVLKGDARLRRRLPRTVGAALVMAVGLWAAAWGLKPLMAAGGGQRIAAVVAMVAGGLAGFLLLARVSGAIEARDLKTLLRPGSVDG
jgi:putative peptidoglycan lipid II flippase